MSTDSEIIIPSSQRAYILPDVKGPLKLIDDHPVPKPESLAPGDCLVRLEYSGVCHSDLSIANDEMSGRQKPDLIGGHEGVGIVVAISAHTRSAPSRSEQGLVSSSSQMFARIAKCVNLAGSVVSC